MAANANNNQCGTAKSLCVTQRTNDISLCMNCAGGTAATVADAILAHSDHLATLEEEGGMWIGVMFCRESCIGRDMVLNLPLRPTGQHP